MCIDIDWQELSDNIKKHISLFLLDVLLLNPPEAEYHTCLLRRFGCLLLAIREIDHPGLQEIMPCIYMLYLCV